MASTFRHGIQTQATLVGPEYYRHCVIHLNGSCPKFSRIYVRRFTKLIAEVFSTENCAVHFTVRQAENLVSGARFSKVPLTFRARKAIL